MTRTRYIGWTVGFLMLLAGLARAENDWTQWRGPHFNGSSEATNLPDSLDPATNLAWQAQLPGVGSATPVVLGDRVFVNCFDEQSRKLLAVCLSKRDGKLLWSREASLANLENDRNNAASPSPVTDGKSVWFYYATGDLAAFDLDGKPLWSRNLQKDHGPFNVQWIYSSSPLFYKGKLYVQVLHRDVPPRRQSGGANQHADSYLLAIDPQSGKDLWLQARPNDARDESKESYATPIPFEHEGRSEILLVGGDCVTAHDAETGKELWRAGGWNPGKENHWRLVPSAVGDEKDGLVFACAPKGGPVLAVRDGGEGDVTSSRIAWQTNEFSSDVCVPLLYHDKLYVLDGDKKVLTCVDPATGHKSWSGSLRGNAVFRASPTGADGKIYCMNERGDIWVLAADEFKVLSKTSLGGSAARATIVVTEGQALVRIGDKLYAFRK